MFVQSGPYSKGLVIEQIRTGSLEAFFKGFLSRALEGLGGVSREFVPKETSPNLPGLT